MKSERGWDERVLKKRKGEERRGAAKTHRITLPNKPQAPGNSALTAFMIPYTHTALPSQTHHNH